MKAKIFSFLTLLVGLTVTTACTDAEDWEHGMNTVFPESVPMGYYHTDSRTFSGLYDYGVVLTKNAAGDQVYYLILEGRKGTAEEGNVYTAFDATDIKYDQKSGVMTVTEPQSFYDGLATSNLIYNYENPDLENLLMQVSYVGDNKETKSVRQVTNGYPNVVAKWKGQSESGKKLELELLAADETGKLVAEATLDGTALTNGTYAYSGATTTVTTAEKTFTISYNEIYQYVVTVDGESFVLDRVVNDPIPETYTEYAAGIVVYNTAYYGTDFAGPFKGESTESILYKSDKFSNKYLLAPYGMNNNGIQIFAHEEGGKTIYTVTNQYVALFRAVKTCW